ncbi:signal recognition particle-docking protein FtsY [Alkalicaulis satelles]|uniref:Signal recognition particle receptor FtsY n=1 Tax=Alkalicaulis satelles TaxID=2609175 RepID=A0A5M6ZGN7_9PROT|nr:signal recognition particle-docking protein FtsY [Alkalicaulis satelles]KAA5803936.1 signal recognition particle-docking protein FtsY [Alkalicaulis satelles]
MSWFRFGFGKKDAAKDAVKDETPTPEAVESEAVESEAVEIEALAEPDAASEPAPQAAPAPEPAPQPATERAAEPEPAPAPDIPAEPARKGLLARLAAGLKKSSSRLSDSFTTLFSKRRLDDAALEELEELLIAADLGAAAAARVTARLARDKFDKEVTGDDIREALAGVVAETLTPCEQPLDMSGPAPRVVVFVGVNGSGKTTTLGKIAVKMAREGASVVTAAGDTFRAAAVEQLQVWSERAGARFLCRPIGSDAAGLAYDAVETARREGANAVLIDTAGRLQNKAELMEELRKIIRVIRKIDESAPHHVILVLDGTVGSNALSQAEAFIEAGGVTGVIMTKLDGTAKGGALVQVAERYNLPIHFIGVGEGEADLQAFSARDFARALSGLEV